jgi:hypothetical protein
MSFRALMAALRPFSALYGGRRTNGSRARGRAAPAVSLTWRLQRPVAKVRPLIPDDRVTRGTLVRCNKLSALPYRGRRQRAGRASMTDHGLEPGSASHAALLDFLAAPDSIATGFGSSVCHIWPVTRGP